MSLSPRARPYAWVILATTIVVGLVVGGLGRFGYTLILPSIRDTLGLNYGQSGFLATTNFAGYLVAALVGGWVNTRLGVRGTSVFGLTCMMAGMVASAFAPGYEILLPLQFPIGFGTGTVMIAAISTLPAWFPSRQRGLIAGIGNGAAGLGILFSGAIVPSLLVVFGPTGWRQIWIAFAVAVAVALVAAAIFLRRRAVSPGPAPTAPPRRLDLRAIYRTRLYWRLATVTPLMGATTSVYGTFFGAYGSRELGIDPATVGQVWGLVGTLSVLSGIVWGLISDKTGRKLALAAVLGVQAVANLILIVTPGLGSLTISAAIAGLTLFGSAAVMTAVMVDVADPEALAAIGGLMAIGFGIGQIGGPAVAGLLADLTGTLLTAYGFSAALSIVAVIAVVLLPALTRPAHPAGARPDLPARPAAPAPAAGAPQPAAGRDRLTRWIADELVRSTDFTALAVLVPDPDLAEALAVLADRSRDRLYRLRRFARERGLTLPVAAPAAPADSTADPLGRVQAWQDRPADYAGTPADDPAVESLRQALAAQAAADRELLRVEFIWSRGRLAAGSIRPIETADRSDRVANRARYVVAETADPTAPTIGWLVLPPGAEIALDPDAAPRLISAWDGHGWCRGAEGERVPLAPGAWLEIAADAPIVLGAAGTSPLVCLVLGAVSAEPATGNDLAATRAAVTAGR